MIDDKLVTIAFIMASQNSRVDDNLATLRLLVGKTPASDLPEKLISYIDNPTPPQALRLAFGSVVSALYQAKDEDEEKSIGMDRLEIIRRCLDDSLAGYKRAGLDNLSLALEFNRETIDNPRITLKLIRATRNLYDGYYAKAIQNLNGLAKQIKNIAIEEETKTIFLALTTKAIDCIAHLG